MDIVELLKYAFTSGVSDLFLTAGKAPSYRINGQICQGENEELIDGAAIDSFRRQMLSRENEQCYDRQGSFVTAASLDSGERFRLSFMLTSFGPGLVARPVPAGDELYIEPLGLPAGLADIVERRSGLILIAGAGGSGKSTTVATLVNLINEKSSRHIISIASPIEFLHSDRAGLVSHRDLSETGGSFAAALTESLRESPDVIAIGNLDTPAAIRAAVEAARNGRLIIAEIDSANTVEAVERVVSAFAPEEQENAARELAKSLLVVIAQRLIPRSDNAGMVAAVELLSINSMVRRLIGERDFEALSEALRRGQGGALVTFNKALFHRYQEGFVTAESGLAYSDNPDELQLLINGNAENVEKQYGTPEDAEDGSGVVDLNLLLRTAVKIGASDLHLSVNSKPVMRVHGELRPLELPVLTPKDTERLLFGILTPRQRLNFIEKRELDFAHAVTLDPAEYDGATECRFRMNGYFQRNNIGVVARVITSDVPSPESLHLPDAVMELCEKQQGLILVTGPTGSGKSTTLASLINKINHTRAEHIITIEDPIEYVHINDKSLIQQREVGADTLSFSTALREALRQDPDVILVGEMRDRETIQAALTAAETGHLVMATLHTNSAPQTIDRIIDSFPEGQQNQIRLQLSSVVIGIVSQRLLSRADTEGRIAAFEILIGTPPVQALIREGKSSQLPSVLETGYKDGMITMRRSLENLLADGLIYQSEADSLSLEAVEVEAF